MLPRLKKPALTKRQTTNQNMSKTTYFKTGLLTLCLLGCLSSLAHKSAKSEELEVCVICNDPGKVYQCSYTPLAPTGGQLINLNGLQFACIKEIAKYGGHSQCGASRQTSTQCQGEPYQLKDAGTLQNARQEPIEILKENPTNKEEQPTLVDTTKESYDKTKNTVKKSYDKTKDTVKKGYESTEKAVKKTVKNVGSTIKDAANSTYDCLTSFFKKC